MLEEIKLIRSTWGQLKHVRHFTIIYSPVWACLMNLFELQVWFPPPPQSSSLCVGCWAGSAQRLSPGDFCPQVSCSRQTPETTTESFEWCLKDFKLDGKTTFITLILHKGDDFKWSVYSLLKQCWAFLLLDPVVSTAWLLARTLVQKFTVTLTGSGAKKSLWHDHNRNITSVAGTDLVCWLVQDRIGFLQVIKTNESKTVGSIDCGEQDKHDSEAAKLWLGEMKLTVPAVLSRTLWLQTLQEGRGSSHGLLGKAANSDLGHSSHQTQQTVASFDPRVHRSHHL